MDEHIQIEKGIPYPRRAYQHREDIRPKGTWSKLIRDMEPGDSVLIRDRRDVDSLMARARDLNIRLSFRLWGKAYRVWRMS